MTRVSDELYEKLVRYARGHCESTEREALEAELADNDDARDLLASICETTAVMNDYLDATEPSDAQRTRNMNALRERRARPRRSRTVPLVAAMTGLAAVLTMAVWLSRPVIIGRGMLTRQPYVSEREWFDVQEGETLHYPGQTLQLVLNNGTNLTLISGSRGRVRRSGLELADGSVHVVTAGTPFVVGLATTKCRIPVPANTMFFVQLRVVDDGYECSVNVNKDAILSCPDGEKAIAAGGMVRLELTGSAAPSP